MKNAVVSRRCPKNKVFAGSGSLRYRVVASVAEQQTQGVTMHMNEIYKRCVMVISKLQQSFWRKSKSDGAMMQSTRHNSYCGRNDHQRKSTILFPFFQGEVHYSSTGKQMLADTVQANTQKMLHVYPVWPVWVYKISQTGPIEWR